MMISMELLTITIANYHDNDPGELEERGGKWLGEGGTIVVEITITIIDHNHNLRFNFHYQHHKDQQHHRSDHFH